MVQVGYNLKKDKIILTAQRRIFFKRKSFVRFMFPLMVLFGFVITISLIAPAFAIETTKASALYPEEMREGYTLSFTKKSPRSAQDDPCLSFLVTRLSPDATKAKDFNNQSRYQRPAGNKAVPVALSFVLGVRIALGPSEVVSPQKRVQFGSEIRNNRQGSNSRALAIAAYRGCKNEQTLRLQNKNNKKRRSF